MRLTLERAAAPNRLIIIGKLQATVKVVCRARLPWPPRLVPDPLEHVSVG